MRKLSFKTRKKREVVDVTDELNSALKRSFADADGVCHLSVLHTTAALTTADLDPGTDLDMLDAFAAMVPKLEYRHPHNPAHVPDHILSSLIGTWQRVVLIELDGPREREIVLTITPEQ